MVLGLFWSWSWWQRSLEKNLPADPELRRAVTETKMSAELSVTMVTSGEVLTLGLETKLTKFTLWYSPIGHTKITCPPESQYKQSLWASQWCRSARETHVWSIYIGLWFWRAGELWLTMEKEGLLALLVFHKYLNSMGNPDGQLYEALKPDGFIIHKLRDAASEPVQILGDRWIRVSARSSRWPLLGLETFTNPMELLPWRKG